MSSSASPATWPRFTRTGPQLIHRKSPLRLPRREAGDAARRKARRRTRRRDVSRSSATRLRGRKLQDPIRKRRPAPHTERNTSSNASGGRTPRPWSNGRTAPVGITLPKLRLCRFSARRCQGEGRAETAAKSSRSDPAPWEVLSSTSPAVASLDTCCATATRSDTRIGSAPCGLAGMSPAGLRRTQGRCQ